MTRLSRQNYSARAVRSPQSYTQWTVSDDDAVLFDPHKIDFHSYTRKRQNRDILNTGVSRFALPAFSRAEAMWRGAPKCTGCSSPYYDTNSAFYWQHDKNFLAALQ
ncbi:hypothetical protein EVAR_82828_1 [Eumeta japonica]|uniref:Uncharacterized protein n=1 Tax=Eumeta variegata TaxID=151549 RepID=A0A4C1V374_EUMVA|nr:hypothetical protein EVAR_82828_1 [Eumeta japonica]